jgi:septal ring factor EnvC (AmiA/AmiB activator)
MQDTKTARREGVHYTGLLHGVIAQKRRKVARLERQREETLAEITAIEQEIAEIDAEIAS